MKYLYNIVLLLLIISSNLKANDNNNVSSVENNSGWHYAVSANYSLDDYLNNASFIVIAGIQAEKKYPQTILYF